jgi:hypothetical protein
MPSVVPDTVTTNTNVKIIGINVISNDTLDSGDFISSVTSTNGSTSVINAKLDYTPTTNFVGTYTITYTLNSGFSYTVTVTGHDVNINIMYIIEDARFNNWSVITSSSDIITTPTA